MERANVQIYVQPIERDEEIVWAMVRTAARSVANLCIFPMQDILGLGSDARMNTPSAGEGNWTWRYDSAALDPQFAQRLAALMEMTDRDGYVAPKASSEP
jgi:4-alpha-glucanotransferase